VQRAIKEMNVGYPVVVDNDYAIWSAFDNHYWPALYFVDAEGRIRHHHFGEGEYEESEMVLQMLLAEAGAEVGDGLVQIVPDGAEAAADWNDLRSPETYLGYERAVGFASLEDLAPDRRQRYTASSHLGRNEWALSGEWTVGAVPIALDEPGGAISFRFHARDVHLVMGPPSSHAPMRFRVRLDAQAPELAHGVDVDEDGNGTADYQRMYQLIRQRQPVTDRTLEIEFLDAGVEVFVFTFG
jgi:Thioredoxin like C-terminal domain